jgi:hypothetical protein
LDACDGTKIGRLKIRNSYVITYLIYLEEPG